MPDKENLSVHGDDHDSTCTKNMTVKKRNKKRSNDTHQSISASMNKIVEAINPSRQQNITLSSPPELIQTDACLLIICSRLNYISKHKQSEQLKICWWYLTNFIKEFKNQYCRFVAIMLIQLTFNFLKCFFWSFCTMYFYRIVFLCIYWIQN